MDQSEDDVIEPAPPETSEDRGTAGDFDVDSLASSGFTSIDTRVRSHVYQGGRRYQSYLAGRYPIPNDDIELSREELKHHFLWLLFDRKFYFAPIGDHPQKILDLGTGSGLWAMAVAEKFTSAQVIGVDLSDIQPYWTPPNVEWRIDDIEREWPELFSGADFIHLRAVLQTLLDPIKVIETSYRNLKPGGWIEIQEIVPNVGCDDNTLPEDYALAKLYDILRVPCEAAYKWNIDFPPTIPKILEDIGFVNIHQKREKLPIGAWARDEFQQQIGSHFKGILWEFVVAILVKHDDLNLTEHEAAHLQERIKQEMDNPHIHAYVGWISVWAQKAEHGTE